MPLTASGEALVLNGLLSGTVYAALYIGDPEAGGVEVSGGSYVRQVATFSNSGSNPTTASNNTLITFPTATADWGTITHFALCDASTGGNRLASNAMSVAKPMLTGDIARFPIGSLTIPVD